MNWELYSALTSNGDFLKLHSHVDAKQILTDIELYKDYWTHYNPNTPEYKRLALPLTSLDGKINQGEGSLQNSGNYEYDYATPTEIYKNSLALIELLMPWREHLGRTQIIKIQPGGYFPAHIDEGWRMPPTCFRLVVPLKNVNPPNFWWMSGDDQNYKPLQWDIGTLYFLNTLKKHSLFNTSDIDSYWLVMNIKLCNESVIEMKRQVYT